MSDDLSPEAIPWPSADHDLRRPSADNRAYAFLTWQQNQGLGLRGRIVGFRRAAEILAEELLARGTTRDLDTVIYPFATCWRHYVEIQLKSLIAAAQRFLGESLVPRGGHNIGQLWSEFKPLLLRVSPGGQADITQAERILKQLAELDPDSQHFRYAERRDREPTLEGVNHLDIADFHQAMLGVAHFLEAIDTMIEVEQDRKDEMASYYQDY